ncbi:protein TonB [Methylohalomonas lacus]|uniref:Protein TonB n=1 Tax=Methylohalomonas lacus TaxID=398773 RepID=A0AAE3L1J0_9GAMM|nr:TonB family protein [Methylohalomonas lacus]MCS3903236.1 protein TonB [Methylohalomonas lacus]
MTPTNQPTPPPVTPTDRLALTLCLAIIVHAVVILGVTFAPQDKSSPQFDPMDVILVQKESEAPDEAQMLAQANLEGGGESEESERPATPIPAPFPEPIARVTPPPPAQVEPLPEPEVPPAPEKVPEPAPAPEPPEPVEQVAVETEAPAEIKQPPEPQQTDPEPEPQQPTESEQPPEPSKPEAEVAEVPDEPEQPTPSASELVNKSLEMASLNAEIQRKMKARAERPKRTFISASTKEYKYASYMEAWRTKVERIGNLNYPEEARKRGLTGSLILDVALKPDGSVDEITIRRSSGTKLLDDAAIRIVELAAPFAPFPDNIRKDTDILHITRTWQFMQGNRFR